MVSDRDRGPSTRARLATLDSRSLRMTEQELEVRFLASADAGAYSAIRLEALELEPDAFSSSAEEHRRLSAEEIGRRLASEDNFVAGAFLGGRLIGTAGFYREKGPKTRHLGFVWGVYVNREARGRGIGRAMMEALLDRATKIAGLEQIRMSVTTTQEAAARLYRSLGFEPWGREPRAIKIGDRYIDEEHMVLHLRK